MLARMSREDARTSVVYVLGTAHGASSILGRLLGIMEGATYAGELRRLWSKGFRPGRTCGCGKPHRDCEVWSKLLVPEATYLRPSLAQIGRVQERAAPSRHSWWHARRILRSTSPASGDTARGRYLSILSDTYRAFGDASDAHVVIDTSKNPGDAALLASAPDISTYCVEIIRDPRGVVFSRRRRRARRKRRAPEDPTRSRPLDTIATTAFWTLSHLASEAVRRKYGPERSLVVRYEELVDAPDESIKALARLVGVSAPTMDVSPGVPIDLPMAHGPDGNGRFHATQLVLKLDDQWKKELHPIDRFLTTVFAYPLLRRSGYPIRMRPGSTVSSPQ